jgi:hypothetical protein
MMKRSWHDRMTGRTYRIAEEMVTLSLEEKIMLKEYLEWKIQLAEESKKEEEKND